MAQEPLEAPAQHGPAAELAVLLGQSAAGARASPGCHDQSNAFRHLFPVSALVKLGRT
jgi:hypothetical protein